MCVSLHPYFLQAQLGMLFNLRMQGFGLYKIFQGIDCTPFTHTDDKINESHLDER